MGFCFWWATIDILIFLCLFNDISWNYFRDRKLTRFLFNLLLYTFLGFNGSWGRHLVIAWIALICLCSCITAFFYSLHYYCSIEQLIYKIRFILIDIYSKLVTFIWNKRCFWLSSFSISYIIWLLFNRFYLLFNFLFDIIRFLCDRWSKKLCFFMFQCWMFTALCLGSKIRFFSKLLLFFQQKWRRIGS